MEVKRLNELADTFELFREEENIPLKLAAFTFFNEDLFM